MSRDRVISPGIFKTSTNIPVIPWFVSIKRFYRLVGFTLRNESFKSIKLNIYRWQLTVCRKKQRKPGIPFFLLKRDRLESTMSALNGKWLLDRIENGQEFLQKLQIPDEDKQKAEVFLDPVNEIIQEIEINGQHLTINISAKNGWSEENKATFGKPVEQCHFGREFTTIVAGDAHCKRIYKRI
ncbi:uncharacterized protein LOC106869788 isoform X2 [Octopus bimaculoides]|uniref:uncharacterized protein LOC106869788 isoform X2 n=1 Tax=Octopus bimaculoides TaxID=37653 RepID=UPI0022E72643|nr:uncharacterized protein LOC106869788 isoform X2 [Octopus bimaculoides]